MPARPWACTVSPTTSRPPAGARRTERTRKPPPPPAARAAPGREAPEAFARGVRHLARGGAADAVPRARARGGLSARAHALERDLGPGRRGGRARRLGQRRRDRPRRRPPPRHGGSPLRVVRPPHEPRGEGLPRRPRGLPLRAGLGLLALPPGLRPRPQPDAVDHLLLLQDLGLRRAALPGLRQLGLLAQLLLRHHLLQPPWAPPPLRVDVLELRRGPG